MNEPLQINCVVIDDENAAITVMKHFIDQIPYLHYLGGFTSPIEGLQVVKEKNAGLVFVDVQMPDINGLELVRHLDKNCKVVLTTAYSQYALDGFDLNVTDYLLKPVPFSRFLKAVEKVKDELSVPKGKTDRPGRKQNDFLLVKGEMKGKYFKIEYGDIDYIESRKNYAAIISGNQKILSLLNIKDVEEKLPADQFIRIHKSFIVSIAKISSIQGNSIILKNPALPHLVIGETYKAAFFEVIKNGLIKPGV